MPELTAKRLQQVLERIANAEKIAAQPAGYVKLLAVSKKQPVEKIRAAFTAGQSAFAESYVQEALEKQSQLHDIPIEWHFIGNIQSNKAKLIAKHFDWVQSVSSIGIAQLLDKHRESLPPLNVCIEVNIDDEPSKSGATSENIQILANEIAKLPHLKLRGLMAIPMRTTDPKAQRITFEKITCLFHTLIAKGFALDTLSMGMSGDLDAAIFAGSNMVRVGTAIFGERK